MNNILHKMSENNENNEYQEIEKYINILNSIEQGQEQEKAIIIIQATPHRAAVGDMGVPRCS